MTTPLTLEYEPEGLEHRNDGGPVLIAEPSFVHPGRIFVAAHPFGHIPDDKVKRAGVHLLPADAERLMNHLAKLLLQEPPELAEAPIDWQARIESAVERQKARKLKLPAIPKVDFRFEFRWGRFVAVIGTETDDEA